MASKLACGTCCLHMPLRNTKKIEFCRKGEMAGVVKSSWPGCLFSYDLTAEDQAGCCICGMISGVLTVTGNIAGTRYPAN